MMPSLQYILIALIASRALAAPLEQNAGAGAVDLTTPNSEHVVVREPVAANIHALAPGSLLKKWFPQFKGINGQPLPLPSVTHSLPTGTVLPPKGVGSKPAEQTDPTSSVGLPPGKGIGEKPGRLELTDTDETLQKRSPQLRGADGKLLPVLSIIHHLPTAIGLPPKGVGSKPGGHPAPTSSLGDLPGKGVGSKGFPPAVFPVAGVDRRSEEEPPFEAGGIRGPRLPLPSPGHSASSTTSASSDASEPGHTGFGVRPGVPPHLLPLPTFAGDHE
ncbi:hypothetical protein BD413DRAFT_32686 [Trametes elegans]|nr:hypothetical protein BD413DRAFT_32686 [Trametes elegans]